MKTKESPEVWSPPELTALVRNKPEETVLALCKSTSTGAAYESKIDKCSFGYPTLYCEQCANLGTS